MVYIILSHLNVAIIERKSFAMCFAAGTYENRRAKKKFCNARVRYKEPNKFLVLYRPWLPGVLLLPYNIG